MLRSSDPEACHDHYAFINQAVACGAKDVIRKTSYLGLRTRIADLIEREKAAGKVRDVSVYFRDLERGPLFGINEIAPFAPASLLKLPLALVYLNSAEVNPDILDSRIVSEGSALKVEQEIRPGSFAEAGREYSIKELLRMMLVDSDNASAEILERFLRQSPDRMQMRQEVFQELGFVNPQSRSEETITVRGYAGLFRLLYNVSFLNMEYSEMALRWLAESDYKNGLAAGVPENVRVSHKFGERLLSQGTRQLHDCGVIYYPDNPYLLCVMTKGDDWESLESLIAEISEMTYQEVDSRRIVE